MKKKKLIGLLLAVAVAAVFILPHFAMSEDPFCSRPHSWTAQQWFRKAVDFFGDIDFTGADIDIDSTSDFDVACEVGFTNGVYFGDEVVTQSYDHASATGALTWAIANGNTLYLSGTTGITVTLPAATAATDGYRLTIKNVSGSAERTVTPNNNSYIESNAGTMTGTADGSIAYPGDYRTWELDYSATSSVWRLIDSHCFIKNETGIKVGGAATSDAATSWSHSDGNFILISGTTGPLVYTLPTITAYMTGFEITFKTESAGSVTVTPVATIDAIESTLGTMTGTSDTTLDAAGDCGTWVAIYNTVSAGVSSVWYFTNRNIT